MEEEFLDGQQTDQKGDSKVWCVEGTSTSTGVIYAQWIEIGGDSGWSKNQFQRAEGEEKERCHRHSGSRKEKKHFTGTSLCWL